MQNYCICVWCGNDFPRRQGKNLYCQPCARERRLQTKREYMARAKGDRYRQNGTPIVCNACGQVIKAKGAKQKFCEQCGKSARRLSAVRYRSSEKGKSLHRRLDAARRLTQHRQDYMAGYIGPYLAKRRRSDPMSALNHRMSVMMGRGLRDGKERVSWTRLAGFSLADLARHIERQFSPGMTWQNIGQWHIDHIRPLSQFKFTSFRDGDFKVAWALANLRPLWAAENLEKRNNRVFLI